MADNLNEFTLDIIDLQLLDALQKDASVSNQALADKVHVSPPTCLRRIKRLREIGIVAAEVAILSPDVLARVQGFGLHALVEVSLDRQGAEELDISAWRVLRRHFQQAVRDRGRVSARVRTDFQLGKHFARFFGFRYTHTSDQYDFYGAT